MHVNPLWLICHLLMFIDFKHTNKKHYLYAEEKSNKLIGRLNEEGIPLIPLESQYTKQEDKWDWSATGKRKHMKSATLLKNEMSAKNERIMKTNSYSKNAAVIEKTRLVSKSLRVQCLN